VVVATVAMAMAMAIMAAVATATQEVALPRWGDAMTPCDGDEAREYRANKAGAGTTAAQLTCTWAAPCSKGEHTMWHPGGGGHVAMVMTRAIMAVAVTAI